MGKLAICAPERCGDCTVAPANTPANCTHLLEVGTSMVVLDQALLCRPPSSSSRSVWARLAAWCCRPSWTSSGRWNSGCVGPWRANVARLSGSGGGERLKVMGSDQQCFAGADQLGGGQCLQLDLRTSHQASAIQQGRRKRAHQKPASSHVEGAPLPQPCPVAQAMPWVSCCGLKGPDRAAARPADAGA
jgi:hypothetical protein